MNNRNNKVLNIPYGTAASLMKAKGMNVLGEAIFMKDAGEKELSALPARADKAVEDVITLMARPAIAARLYIVEEDDSFTSTYLVSDSSNTAFVAKDSMGFKATQSMKKNEALNELISRLEGGAPVCGARAAFELPKVALYILLAVSDLYVRKRMLSLLGHTAPDLSFNMDEVLQVLKEGLICGDPRWLVPFMNQVIPYFGPIPDDSMSSSALQRLSEMGLVNKNSLTGEGMLFAISFYRRICMMGIEIVGAKENSTLAGQFSAFLRGDRMLWFIDDATNTGGEVTVASIGMNEAESLINEYFRPEGIPQQAVKAPQPALKFEPAPLQEAVPPAASPGLPEQQKMKFCYNCGKPLNSNTRFCGGCGTKVM